MLKKETILAGLVIVLFAVAAYSQFAPRTIKEDGFSEYLTGEMARIRVHGAPGMVSEHVVTREDGSKVKLRDMTGKVMLINLWASWCAPCKSEMPELANLQKELGDDTFEVVAINVDRGGIAQARDVLAEWGIEGLPLYAEPTAQIAFDLAQGALPMSLIVDKSGKVRGSFLGPLKWDAPEALDLFTALKKQ
ncbi:thioredoxin [Kordiimonas sediminis]|uniref:Thioredoxin n=1 Tax=Kordiimonas sediminis TaxID=1735581 RepID=A0A919AKE4_9PROT|nr:TlpA disulfide reductase family protein [Kordiimonas sediminis]GHF11676.1 thioredoxin [Kordiimonas sediminis]